MSEFNRDFGRYFVAKTKHLTTEQHSQLLELLLSFDLPTLECVVVESDWPNYEETWQAIKQVAKGEYQPQSDLIEQQQAIIDNLESELTATKHKNHALAAHVGRLHKLINECAGDLTDLEAIERFELAFSETPATSLAEHGAEVASKAWCAGYYFCDTKTGFMSADAIGEEADEYAERIKRGEV